MEIIGLVFTLFMLALVVLTIAGVWITFNKAGQSGWTCLVPFYNIYVLIKIAGRPGWWFLLLFVPIVNFVINIIICIDLAKKFGKGAGFGIGIFLLPVVFFPILAFGDAEYTP